MLRLATVDLGTWIVPIAAFAVAAGPARLSDRFAHYVISSNWGSALIIWMMLPPTLLRMFVPSADNFSSIVSVVLFAISLALTWRLTNVALGKGAAIATAVFAAMFLLSLMVLYGLQFSLDCPASIRRWDSRPSRGRARRAGRPVRRRHDRALAAPRRDQPNVHAPSPTRFSEPTIERT